MSTENEKKSSINIEVTLDTNHLPLDIQWSATDLGNKEVHSKAMLLSFWDPATTNTMKLDLWTKEMSIEEMKQFFHQTLLIMADTFEKATGEVKITEDLKDYCYHFAEKMGILPE